jgi:acetyltransferase-like isoleucine patch superfamily enzyme
MTLRSHVKNNRRLLTAINTVAGGNKSRVRGSGNTIEMGTALLKRTTITVRGQDNTIIIGDRVRLFDVTINVVGDGHTLRIEDGCAFRKTDLVFEDNAGTITVGANTTIEGAHIAAAENGSSVAIGEDCMFSQGIYIATTDSHSILDLASQERINPPQDVSVGDHVWVGAHVKIMKGVDVENGSILGMGSVVTRAVPANVAAAGNPARVVREDVSWVRPRI